MKRNHRAHETNRNKQLKWCDDGGRDRDGVRALLYRQSDTGTDLRVFGVVCLVICNRLLIVGALTHTHIHTQLQLPRCKVKFIWANPLALQRRPLPLFYFIIIVFSSVVECRCRCRFFNRIISVLLHRHWHTDQHSVADEIANEICQKYSRYTLHIDDEPLKVNNEKKKRKWMHTIHNRQWRPRHRRRRYTFR